MQFQCWDNQRNRLIIQQCQEEQKHYLVLDQLCFNIRVDAAFMYHHCLIILNKLKKRLRKNLELDYRTVTIATVVPIIQSKTSNGWMSVIKFFKQDRERPSLYARSNCGGMNRFDSIWLFILPVLCKCCVFRIIYRADKGSTVCSDIKLHRMSPAPFFYPTVPLNVSVPSGAARMKTLLFFKDAHFNW